MLPWYAREMDFRTMPVVRLAAAVRSRQVSAREVTEHALRQIQELDPAIHAFVSVDGERAIDQAAAVDQLVAGGEDPGPLAGVPIGVKDMENAVGYPTTLGSALRRDAPPATQDSILVTRLRAAGCVVVGKTNTPELAFTAKTANATFGATANPWQLAHSPGGSSGGSAAAVAAGLVPLATGSDGGGSIRIPSACCGLSGMKASLGRVPGDGASSWSWSDLSVKGPIARRISDVAAALDVVVGPDPSDIRSLPRPEASWTAAVVDPHLPVRVAWSPTLGYAPLDREVRAICEAAIGRISDAGVEVDELETVFPEDPIADWLVLCGTYLARSLAPFRAHPAWPQVDPSLVLLADMGAAVPATRFVEACDGAERLAQRLVELFHGVRLLLTPTLAGPPPPTALDGAGVVNGSTDANWVRFTYPFNMTRSPAATVCAGLTRSGLPVGLQLVGPHHGDLVVLRSAAALEQVLGLPPLPDVSGDGVPRS